MSRHPTLLTTEIANAKHVEFITWTHGKERLGASNQSPSTGTNPHPGRFPQGFRGSGCHPHPDDANPRVSYKLGGFPGAGLATLGIFIPSFFYVLLLHRFLKKMKSSKILKAFLSAVNVAAVAVMVVVTFKMAQSIIIDWRTALIAIASCFVFFSWKKVNTLYIIAGGALAGFLLSLI